MSDWVWPFTVVALEPPTRRDLADELRISEGDLVAAFGGLYVCALRVLDADGDAVVTVPAAWALNDQAKLSLVLDALTTHPTLQLPGGVWIQPRDSDEWGYTLSPAPACPVHGGPPP